MTRINLIPVEELSDQHLLAELRELPRLFTHVRKHGVNEKHIPTKFVLGKGHMLFFTNKLIFLWNRYVELVIEWEERGFNWSFSCQYFWEQNKDLINSQEKLYFPTYREVDLSRQRIKERLSKREGWYKWTKKIIKEY